MEVYMKISNKERLELLNTVCYAYMGISNINREILNSVSFTPLERFKIKLHMKVKKLEEYNKAVSDNLNSLAILEELTNTLNPKGNTELYISTIDYNFIKGLELNEPKV
jgi:hypothetical protein